MGWANDDSIWLYWYIWCFIIELFKTDAQLVRSLFAISVLFVVVLPRLTSRGFGNQVPTPGIGLRCVCTRGWSTSSALQTLWSRSLRSPLNLVSRSKWPSPTSSYATQPVIFYKGGETPVNKMFLKFVVWDWFLYDTRFFASWFWVSIVLSYHPVIFHRSGVCLIGSLYTWLVIDLCHFGCVYSVSVRFVLLLSVYWCF